MLTDSSSPVAAERPRTRPGIPRAAAGTLLTEGGLLAFGVITGSLVARWLQPEGRGALAAVLFWPQLIASVGLISVTEAVTYRLGDRSEDAGRIATAAVWLALLLAAVSMIVGYLLLPTVLGPERAHLVDLARTYHLVFVPFNFLGLSLLALDHGALRFRRYNLLRLLLPPLYLAGLLFFWFRGALTVGTVVGAGLGAAVVVSGVRIVLQRDVIWGRTGWKEIRSVAAMATHFHPATVLLLLSAQADQLAVLMLWDDAVVGHYMVALTLASSALGVIGGSFQRVLFPHIIQAEDPAEKVRLLARGVRHFVLLLLAVAVPLALLMPWLIAFLVGPAFQDAVGVARILLLAYGVVAVKGILIQGLRGLGDGRAGTVVAATSLGVFAVVCVPLGRLAGLQGVALAMAISNVIALAYLSSHLREKFHLSWRDLWGLDRRSVRESRDVVRELITSFRPGSP